MTTRSVTHATFVVERTYAAAPARVFAAFADPAVKVRWFTGHAGWISTRHEFDFRVGGREHLRGRWANGKTSDFDARYQDIVPGERIVLTYEMLLDQIRISVSLGTTEFKPSGEGTRLIYTEQAVFLDGYDDAGSREHGTKCLFDQLGAFLEKP